LSGGPVDIIAQTTKVDRRPKLWIDSMTFIKERPFTGAGFGRMVIGEKLVKQQADGNHSHAHNIFINYALQLGVLGPLVIVFFFYSIARELWKCMRSASNDVKMLGIAGCSMLGGVFVQSMVEDIFVQHLSLEFWALLGIILGYAVNRSWYVPAPTELTKI
jgi:O-antigen ligase